MKVNDELVEQEILVRQHLVDFLREDLDLTGSHLGCEHGVCGACQVMVDGKVVRGCLTLAVQADGCHVQTIEGLTHNGDLHELQQSFLKHNALQCGFCSSGMLLTALDLVKHHPNATRDQIRDHISGNYCRCTGYQAIVEAIQFVLDNRRSGKTPTQGGNS
tara:strand:+ start:98 stop:580 length:483 start_codon:yes stop_codon:yes gene_type:complete